MNKEDCVIYKGEFFRIEWYFDAKGKSQPYDYYESCLEKQGGLSEPKSSQ